MISLDEIDKQILHELDHNARQSIADLARTLKLNRDRIIYRIKNLQSSGIIRRHTTAINSHKLGLFVFKTYLQLEKNEKRISAFLAHLTKHPNVHWVAECDGKWDLLFTIFARDATEFHAIQEDILFEFSDIIVSFNVYTVIDAYCFRKNYFLGIGTDYFTFGGAPTRVKIDQLDAQILRLLTEDSRQTQKDIADKVGASPMVVKYRIDSLEKSGVIIGYPLDIDLDRLGMSFFKVQFHFSAYDCRAQALLLDYCKTSPNITYFIRQIGDCMIEIELEVDGFTQLNSIISDIRRRFSGFILSIDHVLLKKQFFKWMPSATSMSTLDSQAANES